MTSDRSIEITDSVLIDLGLSLGFGAFMGAFFAATLSILMVSLFMKAAQLLGLARPSN
ncbi:hypothetical protein [Pacificitalea manganoxidans]|uniref:hypothetical protein n=1 Tax=Pacificitalea manganoxidans TaxID=1411902 RepID=UPI0012FE2251|nr:hypothetical protein [Pacificitalea manganoxidans]MDR6309394.1 hypothetical protein [Pacificitalea manganoxidans]